MAPHRPEIRRIRLFGFNAIPGQYVGGGLWLRVPLDRYEMVEDFMLCTHKRSWWNQAWGYLVLTDRRLIQTFNRRPGSPFARDPIAIAYEDMAACTVEKRWHPPYWQSLLASTMAIVTVTSREYLFWPHIANVKNLVQRIELLKAGKLRASREVPHDTT